MNQLQPRGSGPSGPEQPLILQASHLKAKQLQSGDVFLNVQMHIVVYELFPFLLFQGQEKMIEWKYFGSITSSNISDNSCSV